jgi:hypothetical protein
MRTKEKLDIVGLRDIARILEVDGRTPTKWRDRGILPEEDGKISDTFPIWERRTILRWAAETGRLPTQRAAAAGVVETIDV